MKKGFAKNITYNNRNFEHNVCVVMNNSNDEIINIILGINIDYYTDKSKIKNYLTNLQYHEYCCYNSFCIWYNNLCDNKFINENYEFNRDEIEKFCNTCNYDKTNIQNMFTPVLSKNLFLNEFMMEEKKLVNKYLSLEFYCNHPDENIQCRCYVNISYLINNVNVSVNYIPI
jgi:hypothetical protein